VSPQTPLIPPNHPLLVGGYSKAISLYSSVAFEFSVGFLRLHLQSSASTNSPPCHSVTSLLSSLSRGGTILSIYTWFSSKSDPADVALASPQTPLTPLCNPLLPGGYSKPYPCIPFCSRSCSGFFASSLAIIHLNKLSTLSLRLFPPLKPFERRDQSTDIHGFFVCIAISRLIVPPSFSRGWRGRGKSRRLRGMERFVEGVVAK